MTVQSSVKTSEGSKGQNGINSHKEPFQEIKGVPHGKCQTIGPFGILGPVYLVISGVQGREGLISDLWVCLFSNGVNPI